MWVNFEQLVDIVDDHYGQYYYYCTVVFANTAIISAIVRIHTYSCWYANTHANIAVNMNASIAMHGAAKIAF